MGGWRPIAARKPLPPRSVRAESEVCPRFGGRVRAQLVGKSVLLAVKQDVSHDYVEVVLSEFEAEAVMQGLAACLAMVEGYDEMKCHYCGFPDVHTNQCLAEFSIEEQDEATVLCTREMGHFGRHVACGGSGHPLAAQGQDSAVERR